MSQKANLLFLVPVIALSWSLATSSPKADEPATPTGETELTDNLKERLKDALNAPSNENGPRGFVGVVKDIVKSTIVIEGKDGKQNIVVEDATTLLRSPGNKAIKIQDIQIDDNIIAIGSPRESNELLGKRLIVSTKPFSPPAKLSGIGTITAKDKYSFTIKTTDTNELKLFFTKETEYKTAEKKLEPEDIGIGDQILFAAVKDRDSDWSATKVLRTIEALPSPSPTN